MRETLYNLWFQDPRAKPTMINETVVRLRAGMLLMIPIILSYTLYSAAFESSWIVDSATAVDSYDTNFDDQIIYKVEAVRKTYDFTIQTYMLFYVLFEMISGMFIWSSRLSPTILVASFLTKNKPKVWKPLTPKRFAWTLGSLFIATCLVFFNPDIFATWINTLAGTTILPEGTQYMPYQVPITMLFICFTFMWMEALLGYCAGCSMHALLVKIGIFKDECIACNDIFSPEAVAAREASKTNTNKKS